MATPGIADPFAKLSEITGHEITEAMIYEHIDHPEFVSIFLRQYHVKDGDEDLVTGLLNALDKAGWISEAGPDMKHGVWDHFKGGVYLSDGLGLNADSDELEVEYISLLHGTRHHRRCSSWNEIVQWPDGEYRSRFVLRPTPDTIPLFKVPKASVV
jgi:hypothetical protein